MQLSGALFALFLIFNTCSSALAQAAKDFSLSDSVQIKTVSVRANPVMDISTASVELVNASDVLLSSVVIACSFYSGDQPVGSSDSVVQIVPPNNAVVADVAALVRADRAACRTTRIDE